MDIMDGDRDDDDGREIIIKSYWNGRNNFAIFIDNSMEILG